MMNEQQQREYEKWLADNNVPEYMRKLYKDDPVKIRDAMRKKREKEMELQAEKVAERAAQKAKEESKDSGVAKVELYETELKFEKPDFDDEKADSKNEKNTLKGNFDKKANIKKKKAAEKNASASQESVKKEAKKEVLSKAEREKKKKARDKLITAIVALIACLMVALLAYIFVTDRAEEKYETAYISKDVVTTVGSGTGYFVRNSQVFTSQKSGIFVAALEEGDRVAAGDIVGYITDSDNMATVERLEKVKKTILALQNAENNEIQDTDLYEAEQKVAEAKNAFAEMASTGNFEDYEELETALNNAIAERDEILLATKTDNTSITDLQSEKTELEKVIENKMSPIHAKDAGVVSYIITGNEESENTVFAEIKAGSTISLDLLANSEDEKQASLDKQQVDSGVSVCKVVTDQEYYIVLETEAEEELSGTMTVYSEKNDFQAAGAASKLGDNLYAINTLRSLAASLEYEQMKLDFDTYTTSGYCVPVSALCDFDSGKTTAKIAVVRANIVKFVYVGISYIDDEKAIITDTPFGGTQVYDESGKVIEGIAETFTSGDRYVLNAKNVKEGQTID